jgi:hypothetical protein
MSISSPMGRLMIGLLRTAVAVVLVWFASGTLSAHAGASRGVPAPGWTNATYRSVSRVPARVTSPRPGLTVLPRQFLDDINARTGRDALQYVPGVDREIAARQT